jgi:hypothetical protein
MHLRLPVFVVQFGNYNESSDHAARGMLGQRTTQIVEEIGCVVGHRFAPPLLAQTPLAWSASWKCDTRPIFAPQAVHTTHRQCTQWGFSGFHCPQCGHGFDGGFPGSSVIG